MIWELDDDGNETDYHDWKAVSIRVMAPVKDRAMYWEEVAPSIDTRVLGLAPPEAPALPPEADLLAAEPLDPADPVADAEPLDLEPEAEVDAEPKPEPEPEAASDMLEAALEITVAADEAAELMADDAEEAAWDREA